MARYGHLQGQLIPDINREASISEIKSKKKTASPRSKNRGSRRGEGFSARSRFSTDKRGKIYIITIFFFPKLEND